MAAAIKYLLKEHRQFKQPFLSLTTMQKSRQRGFTTMPVSVFPAESFTVRRTGIFHPLVVVDAQKATLRV